MLDENVKRWAKSQGSARAHHAWVGGYLDHIIQCIRLAEGLYPVMAAQHPLPFSLSDAALVLFLHDLEKPWKYVRPALTFFNKQSRHDFRAGLVAYYELQLTPDHLNALKYVEGELDDYKPGERVMGPLAAFCHMCDVASARIWFAQGGPA